MSDFVVHLQELTARWAPVAARRMFGGLGLYREGIMFALVADDVLYLKVDGDTKARFVAAGCAPFRYEGKGKAIEMSYWSAPADCLESEAAMLPWCELAYAAARRARLLKSPATRRAAVGGKPR